jgi:hypothetical protein
LNIRHAEFPFFIAHFFLEERYKDESQLMASICVASQDKARHLPTTAQIISRLTHRGSVEVERVLRRLCGLKWRILNEQGMKCPVFFLRSVEVFHRK